MRYISFFIFFQFFSQTVQSQELRADSVAVPIIKVQDSVWRGVVKTERDTLSVFWMKFTRIDSIKVHAVYGRYSGGMLAADTVFHVSAPAHVVQEILRKRQGREWLFYLFCGILLILAFIRSGFDKYISNLFQVFFNTSLKQKQLRDQLVQSALPSLILNIFFFLTGGIYLFFVFGKNPAAIGFPAGVQILFWSGCLAILYISKYILFLLGGWVFAIKDAAQAYIFEVFNVNKMTGLVLLPVVILLGFLGSGGFTWALSISYGILLLMLLFRLIRGYLAVNQHLRVGIMHYILFVLAFEWVPVMLLQRLLVNLIT